MCYFRSSLIAGTLLFAGISSLTAIGSNNAMSEHAADIAKDNHYTHANKHKPVTSATWQNYVQARLAGTEPELPDFSYAGYRYGNEAIPHADHDIFDVADYGAIPDDNADDTAAIQAAIDAASANGAGIVLLHKGRYIARNLRVSSNNTVVRGAGALPGGTELFSPNPGRIILFRPRSTGNKRPLTTVTANVQRETFNVEVADASGISVGQRVTLYSRDPSPGLLKDFFAPFTPAGPQTLSRGVEVVERHTVTAINGNTLTFAEPIHYEVNASYNWVIRRAGSYIEESGLEDVALIGNWNKNRTFVHHRSTLDDQGWRGVEMNHGWNSWIQRVRVQNTNRAIEFKNSVNCSGLELVMEGNDGHHGMLLNISTRVLVGLVQERNIWEHPAGQTAPNVGNVFWRYTAREVMETDNHGKYGYATLRDLMTGHLPGNGSGSYTQSPRHLRYYTLWNYKYTFSGPAFAQEPHNFWTSIFSSIVPPIVVGYQAPPNLLVLKAEDVASPETPKPVYPTMQINESYGRAVTPESLYEAQLTLRLGELPDWVHAHKQSWKTFGHTNVAMAKGLNNAVFQPHARIHLSASVAKELKEHVEQVDFYHDDHLLGSDNKAPYSLKWKPEEKGVYRIHARVVRKDGHYGISKPVNVLVGPASCDEVQPTLLQALIDPAIDLLPGSHLLDDNLNTHWTSNAAKQKPNHQRVPQLIDFDLGQNSNVNRVNIAWHQGKKRAYYLRIHVSEDNSTWKEVLRTQSKGNSNDFETYYFDGGSARYVRIIGFTNSLTRSSEISEIKFYSASDDDEPWSRSNKYCEDNL